MKRLKKEFEFCSVHFYCELSTRHNGIFYVKRKYKEDSVFSKKGDLKEIIVFVSNADLYSIKDCPEEYFMSQYCEEDIYSLEFASDFDPILAGRFFGSDFYFYPELMTGTQTDEQDPRDFMEAFIRFKEIVRDEYKTPDWDTEEFEIKVTHDKGEYMIDENLKDEED